MTGPLTTLGATTVAALLALTLGAGASQERARRLPDPETDIAPSRSTSEIAVLAGGCFWGVQGVYQHVKGVTRVLSGYIGGSKETATYERVSAGGTGHAEAVEITFDPRKISYGRILQVFFSVVHDPTQLNRQGPDAGPEYRSAIFPLTAGQDFVARRYIEQLDKERTFNARIVTVIELSRIFYWAEPYHQDYLQRNPADPYIVANDLPKIANLKRLFADRYTPTPVLVGSAK